jgi:hypothetical protein
MPNETRACVVADAFDLSGRAESLKAEKGIEQYCRESKIMT